MLLLTLLVSTILTPEFILAKFLQNPQAEDTLILTHILFRHGDRTPISTENFPTNPYINDTFFPYGVEELNLAGKKRAYDLGCEFRKRYNTFLGPIYYIDLIKALSTETDRTIMSLQAVLAGMFPPSKPWILKRNLNWQPVLYKYLDEKTDILLTGYSNCPNVMDVEANFDDETREIVDYLSQKTGGNLTTLADVFIIQNVLQVLEENGKKLPSWVKPIWPEPLKRIALKSWSGVINRSLPQVSGELIRKINEDTAMKINGTLLPKNRKVFMYSGHDINVIGLLGVLGVYDGSEIHYSSSVIIELHKIDGVYGIKVFFENKVLKTFKPMYVPNCGTFCPFNNFVKITQKFYLKKHDC